MICDKIELRLMNKADKSHLKGFIIASGELGTSEQIDNASQALKTFEDGKFIAAYHRKTGKMIAYCIVAYNPDYDTNETVATVVPQQLANSGIKEYLEKYAPEAALETTGKIRTNGSLPIQPRQAKTVTEPNAHKNQAPVTIVPAMDLSTTHVQNKPQKTSHHSINILETQEEKPHVFLSRKSLYVLIAAIIACIAVGAFVLQYFSANNSGDTGTATDSHTEQSPDEFNVNVSAGNTISDIAATVESSSYGQISSSDFEQSCNNAIARNSRTPMFSIKPSNVTGYLATGTYIISSSTTADGLVDEMIQKQSEQFTASGLSAKDFSNVIVKAQYLETTALYTSDKQMLSQVVDTNPRVLADNNQVCVSPYDIYAAINPSGTTYHSFTSSPDKHLIFQ